MAPKSWDNSWISFSRATRRGAFVFLTIFALVVVLPRIIKNYSSNDEVNWRMTTAETEEPEIKNDLSENNQSKKNKFKKSTKRKYNVPKESFNPNDLSVNDWQDIGLSEKQATTLINFKDKIGGFKSKTDVKKVFVISDELFDQLKNKINLPDEVKSTPTKKITDKEILLVDLNSATGKDLQQIKGIGKYFSEKLIEMRDKLGGYIEVEQLGLIYNMTEEKINEIKPYLFIDLSLVKKLDINKASLDELKNHPYINWDVANSIIELRKSLEGFTSVDQILISPYIERDLYKKIVPYLIVK